MNSSRTTDYGRLRAIYKSCRSYWYLKLLVFCQFLVLFQTRVYDPDPHHDGQSLAMGIAVAQGSKLYVDLKTYYQPVPVWISSLWFEILPRTLVSLRTLSVIVIALIAILIFLIGKFVFSSILGLTAASIWMASNTALLDYWPMLYWPNLVVLLPFLTVLVLIWFRNFDRKLLLSQRLLVVIDTSIGLLLALSIFSVFLVGILGALIWLSSIVYRCGSSYFLKGVTNQIKKLMISVSLQFVAFVVFSTTILHFIGFNNRSEYFDLTFRQTESKFSTDSFLYMTSLFHLSKGVSFVFFITCITMFFVQRETRKLGIRANRLFFQISGSAIAWIAVGGISITLWNLISGTSSQLPSIGEAAFSIRWIISLSISAPFIAIGLSIILLLQRNELTGHWFFNIYFSLVAIGLQAANSLHSQDLSHLWWGSALSFLPLLQVFHRFLNIKWLWVYAVPTLLTVSMFGSFVSKVNLPRDKIDTPHLATNKMYAETDLAGSLHGADRLLDHSINDSLVPLNFYCIDLLYSIYDSRVIVDTKSLFWLDQTLDSTRHTIGCQIEPRWLLAGLERWTEQGFRENLIETKVKQHRIRGNFKIKPDTKWNFYFSPTKTLYRELYGKQLTSSCDFPKNLNGLRMHWRATMLDGSSRLLTSPTEDLTSISTITVPFKVKYLSIEFLKTTSGDRDTFEDSNRMNALLSTMKSCRIHERVVKFKRLKLNNLIDTSGVITYAYGGFQFPYTPYYLGVISP